MVVEEPHGFAFANKGQVVSSAVDTFRIVAIE
jgi:hypothetical protein